MGPPIEIHAQFCIINNCNSCVVATLIVGLIVGSKPITQYLHCRIYLSSSCKSQSGTFWCIIFIPIPARPPLQICSIAFPRCNPPEHAGLIDNYRRGVRHFEGVAHSMTIWCAPPPFIQKYCWQPVNMYHCPTYFLHPQPLKVPADDPHLFQKTQFFP